MTANSDTQRLVDEWRNGGRSAALAKLVSRNEALIRSEVRRFRCATVEAEDLYQQGVIGFLKAVARYDPAAGASLSTYAVPWIRDSMRSYSRSNRFQMKVVTTSEDRKLFPKFGKLMNEAQRRHSLDENAALDWVSDQAGVSRKSADKAYAASRIKHVPADEANDLSATGGEVELVDTMTIKRLYTLVRKGMEQTLNARERLVVQYRWIEEEPMPHERLASLIGVSRTRVRQLECGALEKLRVFLRENGVEQGLAA